MTDLPYQGERLIPANGIEICYDAFGWPEDPAFLLIAGFSSQMIFWDEDFCRSLAAQGYWVIRYDNRDVGRSTQMTALGLPDLPALWNAMQAGQMPVAPYSTLDMAHDALGLLDALGIAAAHMLGASLGGWLAQLLVLHYPQRVRTLATFSSSSAFPRSLLPPNQPAKPTHQPPPADREAFIERMEQRLQALSGPRYPPDHRERIYLGRMWERGFYPDGIQRQRAAGWTFPDLRSYLPALTLPVLVIHGDADPTIPLAYGRETASLFPQADLLVIEGLGHQRLPPAVWPTVVQTLARLARRED